MHYRPQCLTCVHLWYRWKLDGMTPIAHGCDCPGYRARHKFGGLTDSTCGHYREHVDVFPNMLAPMDYESWKHRQ